MSVPSFSVVVPTFNRSRELTQCVDAIAQCSFDRERFEVIVVNDGGGDPAPAVRNARSLMDIRILSQANHGPGAARNLGASAARGEFLIFTDDDCIPAKTWLSRLEESVLANPESLSGGRTVNLLQHNGCSVASQSLVDYVHRYYNDGAANRTRFFASNNIALPAAMFGRIGGFDESLCAAEDRDFCRTWHRRGWEFHYAPDAVTYHAHHLTLRSFQKQHFTYGRGAFPYWRKASSNGSAGLRVEPLSFYTGMLAHPFTQKIQKPAIVASLILLSQVANAAGFAYEALRPRTATTRNASRQEIIRRFGD